MNFKFLLKMTLHQQFFGQIFWVAICVALLLLLLLASVSGLAMSHQIRMMDTFSYFLVDILSMFLASILGSQIYTHDFCNRGIAEILVPIGIKKQSILSWRILSYAVCIGILVLSLFVFRLFCFLVLDAGAFLFNFFIINIYMFMFIFLKSSLVLIISCFLGIHIRPLLALLACLALFVFGHFSAELFGMQAMQPEQLLNPVLAWLLKILKIWNPNYLVLGSFQGQWEQPPAYELGFRVLWGLGFCGVFYALCLLSISKKIVFSVRG